MCSELLQPKHVLPTPASSSDNAKEVLKLPQVCYKPDDESVTSISSSRVLFTSGNKARMTAKRGAAFGLAVALRVCQLWSLMQ